MTSKYTEPTTVIQTITNKFSQNKFKAVFEAMHWIRQNTSKIPYDMKTFRTRTAEQIVNDKTVMGCTDVALVFMALMNALSIKVSYIETVSEKTLKEMKVNPENDEIVIYGHVFVRVEIEDQIFVVDPTFIQISLRKNLPAHSMFIDAVIIDEGDDFEELGLNSTKDIRVRTKAFIKNEWKVDEAK